MVRCLTVFDNFPVNINYLGTRLIPCYAVDFIKTIFPQLIVHGRICDDGMNGIGHSIDVSIICLNHIVENLGTSALLGYNGGNTHLHSFKRRYAEWL